MARGKSILKGFLGALIISLLSFLVIYFLFPDLSEKSFGLSFANGVVTEQQRDVSKLIEGVKTSLKESGATEQQITAVVEQLKNSNVWDDIKDGSVDAARKIGEVVSDAAKSVNLDVGIKTVEESLSKIDFKELGKSIGSFASGAFSELLKKVK